MPSCPQCSKPLLEINRQCPYCRADLDLLVDYVQGLRGSLSRAEEQTRAGNLGQAMWAYLEVLEVDPDNAAARAQVGQIATAVRQFDQSAPGRRWIQGLPPLRDKSGLKLRSWTKVALIAFAVFFAFTIGYMIGVGMTPDSSTTADTRPDKGPPQQDSSLMGPSK